MCGRFILDKTFEDIKKFYELNATDILTKNFIVDYNITPLQSVPVIVYDKNIDCLKVVKMRWGYTPTWFKKLKTNSSIINSRIEDIELKPSFQEAFRYQRCLIPTTGFYEWDKNVNPKQPYFIHKKAGELFSLGGIYLKNIDDETNEITYNFTIITSASTFNLTKIHERMPLSIDPSFNNIWLKQSPLELKDKTNIINNSISHTYEIFKVGTLVNNPINNNADLIKPL